MKLVSYSEAHNTGLKTYFTGIPCCRGHVVERRTKDKACLECRRLYKKRYQKSDAWKRQAKAQAKRYRSTKENSIKLVARSKMNWALIAGRLKKAPCEVCGSEYRIHGHHDDYSKPYDVKWLCTKHHHERHKQLEEKGIFL